MSRNLPLVSVVVIFLNEERFLAEAVESVFGQTYAAWELILVDDGSTDRSAEIASSFASRDPRVRYVSHPAKQTRGMSASRNLGVAASRGELIAFLDADDVWLPRKLEEQVELIESHPEIALLYGRTEWWFSWTGRPEDTSRDYLYDPGVELDSTIEPPQLLPSLIRNDGSPPYTCSVLIRREAYERLGGFEPSFTGLYEDQAFFAKAFLSERVFVSSRCWDRYRQHDQSACAVGLRNGDLHPLDLSPSRGAFLEWLDRYLDANKVYDPALREPLTAELEPYRWPAAPAVVESVQVASGPLPGLLAWALDLPRAGERTRGRKVHVMGWAIGDGTEVTGIRLRSEGRVIREAPLGRSRPDLSTAFPAVREAARAGFTTSVSLVGMAALCVRVSALLRSDEEVEFARFQVRRRFRATDASLGFPLVSVIVLGGDEAEVEAAIESVLVQSYPQIELIVAGGDPRVGNAAARVPGVRFVSAPARAAWVAALRSAWGELVVCIEARERLQGDAIEAGVATLAASPGAASVAIPSSDRTAPLEMHRRFTLDEEVRGPAARSRPSGSRWQHGTTVILAYHRVAELEYDPWGLAVSPERFSEQLEVLRQHYDVVPLSQVFDSPARCDRVVITFDDGYADNLDAARLLCSKDLPATFFLVGVHLGEGREFWWDELEHILLGAQEPPDTLELEIRGSSVTLSLPNDGKPDRAWRATHEPRTSRERAYLELYRSLHLADSDEREAVLEQLAAWAGVPRVARPCMRRLSAEQVVDLGSFGPVEIGAHTLTHPSLAALSRERQRAEIVGGRDWLANLLGRPVESFAYPHGSRSDYTDETVALVAEAGFQRACTAEGRPIRGRYSPLELPRMMVEDVSGEEFERRLCAVFTT